MRAEVSVAAGTNQIVMNYDMNDGSIHGYDDFRFVAVTTSGGTVVANPADVTISQTVTGSGNQTTHVTITFNVPSAGSYFVRWDLHVASALTWGAGNGAGSYNGSSLHTVVEALNCVGSGSKTLPAPFKAIETGTLTVDKVTVPSGDPTLFDLTISSNGETLPIQLADQTTPWTSLVGIGSFTVSEVDIPAGWSLTNLVCTGTTAVYQGSTATFTMVDKGNVKCTFTNSKITYKDLTVTKTAVPSYTAAYHWAIQKVADQTTYTIAPDGTVEVGYTVTASEAGVTYSSPRVDGTITIANANAIPIALTGVTDSLPGATCSLDAAAPTSVAANSSVTVDYTCTIAGTSIPPNGTNSATVTWNKDLYFGTTGTSTGTAPVDWSKATVTTVDKTVEITDTNQTWDPAWTLTYGDPGNDFERTYTVVYPRDGDIKEGGCYTIDNTADVRGAQGAILASDGATVDVCELGITKDIMGESTATFTWDITKTADAPTTVNDPDGSHSFGYSVTVDPSAPAYTGSRVYGTIDVNVPSGGADVTGSLSDYLGLPDTTCVVAGTTMGTVTVPADGLAHSFTYSCDLGTRTPTVVVNTAVLVWGSGGTQQQATATATLAADAWQVGLVDETLVVHDDMAGSSDVLLGTVTVALDGTLSVDPADGFDYSVNEDGTVTFTYDVTHTVEPGTCQTFVNTATGTPGDEGDPVTDDATANLCAPADLTVTKTASTSYTKDHDWTIQKDADETLWTVGPTGSVDVTYTVTAREAGVQYRDVAVDGTITITNPNTGAVTLTSVVDSAPGAVCALDEGAPSSIAGGATLHLDYTCDYPDGTTLPDDSTNTATVDYLAAFGSTPSTATGTAPIDWATADVTHVDDSVTITDTNYTWDPAWVIHAGDREDGTYTRTYTLTYEGQDVAQCTPYDNTASLWDDGIERDADETVTVCTLTGSKTAWGSATADFGWDITKTGGPDTVVDNSGSHDFAYSVTVDPSDPVYSDYTIAGQILLTNPEGSEPVTGALSDYLGIEGAACTVQGTDEGQVTVPADGEAHAFDYSCTLPDLPEPTEVVNTAVFVWADGTQEVTSTATVAADEWDVALRNESIDVYDDMAGDTQVLIGTVTVGLDGTLSVEPVEGFAYTINEDGTVTFTYDVTHTVEPGTCQTFVNTATGVPGDEGPWVLDDASVELCAEVDLGVTANAAGTYDVSYPWTITKDVDQSQFSLPAGSKSVDATYTVVATAGTPVVSGHELKGTIEVTNSNDWAKDFAVTTTFPGGTCTVGGPTTVAANSTASLTFDCTFGSDYTISKDEAANLATVDVEWTPLEGEDVTSSATATAAWTVDKETNRSVDVVDLWQGKTMTLGTLSWVDGSLVLDKADDPNIDSATLTGSKATFVYTLGLDVSGSPNCTAFENIARVIGDGKAVLAKDSAETRVCVAAPGLAKTGADILDLSALILGSLLLGGALLVGGRRRRRS